MYRIALAGAIAAVSVVGTAAAGRLARGPAAPIRQGEVERLQLARKVVQDIRKDVPEEYWDRARCVAVIPDVRKAAFVLGGEYGKGVTSCRAGDVWSAPVFMQLAKGSLGFQAGAQQVDLVLLVMNESGVQKLLQDKVTLGADASVAAGPIGREESIATDRALTAEILSYSRAAGLFAGIDLSGGVLRPDEDANTDVYGRGATPRLILARRESFAPPEAAPFLEALRMATGRPTSTLPPGQAPDAVNRDTRSSAPEAKAVPRSTTEEIRARLIALEQAIDRMLAESTPAAVGTAGADAPGTPRESVVVNRARLLQLRAEIDALVSGLDRR